MRRRLVPADCRHLRVAFHVKRSRINPVSQRTRDERTARAECKAAVRARSGGQCEYAEAIWEIPCAFYPHARRAELECDELRGGSWRRIEYLNPDRCRDVCPAHHDWKTEHKWTVLERLDALGDPHALATPTRT